MTQTSGSEAILARLAQLHPRKIDLSLGRIETLLARLGHPERALPPTIHVAGTNGKGSTVAFMRACLEAAGLRTHVYTSPHLVSFHERIRLTGALVDEARLIEALRLCEDLQNGEPITQFEIVTAAALRLFSDVPADALLLEVGLGGRYDATNVIDRPVAAVITPISLDHQEFLGSTLTRIAAEKAGIVKRGAPTIVARQEDESLREIERETRRAGSRLLLQERDFDARRETGRLVYEDESGLLDLSLPKLSGRHQIQNAAVAIATLRTAFPQVAAGDFDRGMSRSEWPARMQNLTRGPLVALAPPGAEIWLDGGHNEAGGRVAADAMGDFEERAARPLVVVCGMLATKDPKSFLASFKGLAGEVAAVSFSEEAARPPGEIASAARELGLQATEFATVGDALQALRARTWATAPRILIAGSLHLAGDALRLNGAVLR
jgi:dihydrofolate synthase / folylpolyglutamate synthase